MTPLFGSSRFRPEPFQPSCLFSSSRSLVGTKKGWGVVFYGWFYGRFLSISTMTAPTIAIATIMEAMPGNR